MSPLKAIDDMFGGAISWLLLLIVGFAALVVLALPSLLPMMIVGGSSWLARRQQNWRGAPGKAARVALGSVRIAVVLLAVAVLAWCSWRYYRDMPWDYVRTLGWRQIEADKMGNWTEKVFHGRGAVGLSYNGPDRHEELSGLYHYNIVVLRATDSWFVRWRYSAHRNWWWQSICCVFAPLGWLFALMWFAFWWVWTIVLIVYCFISPFLVAAVVSACAVHPLLRDSLQSRL